jgi:hypothetical protein
MDDLTISTASKIGVNFGIFLSRQGVSPRVSLGSRHFRYDNDFRSSPDLVLGVQQRPLEGAIVMALIFQVPHSKLFSYE